MSLRQAIDYAKGDEAKVRKRTIAIKGSETFSANDVKDLRLRMNLTQKPFATLIGVSVKTIEAWERGSNQPSGTACRLLEVLSNEPNLVEEKNHIDINN